VGGVPLGTPDLALAIALGFRRELAVLDISLPGMSGYELVAALAALPELPNAGPFPNPSAIDARRECSVVEN
jgi:CheY-like chemotaxis protein